MKGIVYVLEDDASIGGLVKFSLEREQLTCRTFGSIREFEAALREKVPDIALLDIMLPDGMGWKFCNRSRTGIPVYAVSCSAPWDRKGIK